MEYPAFNHNAWNPLHYEPDDYRIGRDISLASSILLYLLAIVAAAGMLAGKPKETKRK